MFANRLILSECMNALNLWLQIYCTNKFLGGQFYNLGTSFWYDDFTGRMDVLDIVFPKVTKCDFFKYGQSGSIQRHDALCVMALNVINEKIFVVLWFWYGLLAVITVVGLVWRCITIFMHSRWINFVSMELPIVYSLNDVRSIFADRQDSTVLFSRWFVLATWIRGTWWKLHATHSSPTGYFCIIWRKTWSHICSKTC